MSGSTPGKSMEIQFRFAERLKDHGITVYLHSLMDIPTRWEVIRSTIVAYGFADKPMRKGSDETYAAAYERATEQLLQPKQENAA